MILVMFARIGMCIMFPSCSVKDSEQVEFDGIHVPIMSKREMKDRSM